MPRTRYERELDRYAGPRFRHAVLIIYLLAVVIGLIAGIAWVAWLIWTMHIR